jgi:hypothetical protein
MRSYSKLELLCLTGALTISAAMSTIAAHAYEPDTDTFLLPWRATDATSKASTKKSFAPAYLCFRLCNDDRLFEI